MSKIEKILSDIDNYGTMSLSFLFTGCVPAGSFYLAYDSYKHSEIGYTVAYAALGALTTAAIIATGVALKKMDNKNPRDYIEQDSERR